MVTAAHDRDYVNDHLLPAAMSLEEGSMWDITQLGATIVLTQRNRAVTTQIYDWVARHHHDPWRGIEAIVARDLNDPNAHEAFIPITIGHTSLYWAHPSGSGLMPTSSTEATPYPPQPSTTTTPTTTVTTVF